MTGATEDRYRGEAGQRYQQQKRAVPAEAIPWVARLRAEKLQPHIDPSACVVEFGAGLGWNLSELRCSRRIATDLENFLPADSRIEFVRDSPSIQSNLADALICHHVLEHVASPLAMLAEASRILKSSGVLLLNVPFEKETRYRSYDPSEPNHHLYSWNVQTLGNLASDAGFNIREIGLRKFGYDRAAATLTLKLRIGETGFRFLRAAALGLIPAYEVQLIAVKKSG